MTANEKSLWSKDIAPYTQRGELCELWGKPAAVMTKKELLGFVGFLDSVIEDERRERKENP